MNNYCDFVKCRFCRHAGLSVARSVAERPVWQASRCLGLWYVNLDDARHNWEVNSVTVVMTDDDISVYQTVDCTNHIFLIQQPRVSMETVGHIEQIGRLSKNKTTV